MFSTLIISANPNNSTIFIDNAIIIGFIGFAGVLLSNAVILWQNYKIKKSAEIAIKRSDKIYDKNLIEIKLKEFYIPLSTYLENSNTLFKIFKKDKPDGFRTLTHLLDRDQTYGISKQKVNLGKNDNSILSGIISLGEKIENLIYEKSYLIGDDDEFVKNYKPRESYIGLPYEKNMSLLSLLVSHIVVTRMAYNGDLYGQSEKFLAFVFPKEVNARVNEKIDQLNNLVSEIKKDI